MSIIAEGLQSSTPDGLAPLSYTAVLGFSLTLSLLPLAWAAVNLVLLLRGRSVAEGEGDGVMLTFRQLCSGIITAVVEFLKYNYALSWVAGLIFFLIIFGAIEDFQKPEISLIYLYGMLECTAVGIIIAVVSQLGLKQIGMASTHSAEAVHSTARLTSNFITYLVCGLGSLIFSLILVVGETQKPTVVLEDLKSIGKKLIAYAFGVSTVAIGTKINSVIYGKGAEAGLSLMAEMEPDVPRNHSNPAVICKALGENVRKIVSNATDYNMYLCMSVACGVSAGAMNIIGADQNGQIIFSLSSSNIYLPLMAVLFLLAINFITNVSFTFLFQPSSGEEAGLTLKREVYVVAIFMSGFLALAAYLSLPVEFFVREQPGQLKGPQLAYLSLLIALFALLALLIFSEIQVNHPRAIYSILYAGGESEASGLLSCLEMGWIGSALPALLWGGLAYLGQQWLGSYGVSLMSVGTALMIPNYLNINTYYSLVQNCSFISWVGEVGEDGVANLMQIGQGNTSFEVQVNSHYTSVALTTNYALILNYIALYDLKHIPLINSGIFIGLILGAVFIYSLGSVILLSIQNITPLLCYEVRAQMQENPAIKDGTMEIDVNRTNSILCLNSLLQFKYFLPYLLLPFALVGLLFGPKMTLGVITGMLVAGLQLAFSSGLSGSLWSAARAELFLGKAMSSDGERFKADSQEAKAVDLGNDIGMRLKDAIGSCVHGFISFTALTNAVMGGLYCSLHQ